MSGILSAIFRSVSGPTVHKVEEADISLATSTSSDGTDGSPQTPNIIVFKGLPYVYQGRQQNSPTKVSPKLSKWRTEQLRRANPARLIDDTPRPLATLYGPNSLPYARNPSGVDAQLDLSARPTPLPKDPATLFRERMNEHLDSSKITASVREVKTQVPPAQLADSSVIVDINNEDAMLEDSPKPSEEHPEASNRAPEPARAADLTPGMGPQPAHSTTLRAQINKTVQSASASDPSDPFKPLFEKAIQSHAQGTEEQAIIDDLEKYIGKADADANWRKRDEPPQTVMTMDALFEKFAPSTAPIKVNSPLSANAKRPLGERKNAASTPRRHTVSERNGAQDTPNAKAVPISEEANFPAKPTPLSKPARISPGSKSARAATKKPSKGTPANKAKPGGASEPSVRRSLRT